MYQKFEQLRQSNGDPMQLYKQVTNNFSPEQMQGFTNFAKQFGFSEEQINQLNNGINTK